MVDRLATTISTDRIIPFLPNRPLTLMCGSLANADGREGRGGDQGR